MTQKIEKTILIKAPAIAVWSALTIPETMKRWMAEPAIDVEITTDWNVGNPIVIKGFHHIKFENKGTVLQFVPNRILQYDFLSSLSKLPDQTENYSIVTFTLSALHGQTSLTLTLSNFPTESIMQHLDFYWKTTLLIMKNVIETDLT
jgi:uncharacterized protein YndB with AHSA1/START domain